MWLRHTLDFPPPDRIWEPDGEPVRSVTGVDPTLLHTSSLFGFVAQWHLPEVTWGRLTDDGTPGIRLSAPDGSRASVHSTSTGGGFPVTQTGPHRLWDRVEEAHEFWRQAGQPHYDRFGITATTTGQHVWYHPDSGHRWQLPQTSPRTIQPIS
ncbi:MAG: hypothetical protein ACRDRI_23015 [Pseudonocardiaceae bacterium]